MIAVWAILGMVLVAFALQHVAYILQYGSLFETHRRWLKFRSRRYWLAAKLYELVMCQLCTTTQLALWWITLPTAWVTREWMSVEWVVGLTVLWFSTAAFSLMAWDIARLLGRGSDALILAARSNVRR